MKIYTVNFMGEVDAERSHGGSAVESSDETPESCGSPVVQPSRHIVDQVNVTN